MPVVTVWLRCPSAAERRYVMAGAALVHSVWATTPAETQKLACRPRTKGPCRRVGRIGESSIRTIELDIDLLPRRIRERASSRTAGAGAQRAFADLKASR